MKKEIRQISDDGKTVRVTIADERWYIKTEKDEDGVITDVKEYPSVTWIADNYPKGIGYMQWLAKHGWDESKALAEAAGDRGHKVHEAITHLLTPDKDTGKYNTIAIDSMLRNSETGQ